MDSHLRAGIAIFNAGEYHTAHDAWEDHWLDLETGTDDELFLHGLIQYTAAVHHARNRNWSGATGLAGSARGYLASLPGDYRGVNVGPLRRYLATLGDDPEFVERRPPLALYHEGGALVPSDLDFEATAVAAECLAEKRGEADAIERGIAFARADIGGTSEPLRGETDSPFVPLVFDYVRQPDRRGLIVARLTSHADRRRTREEDVSGLFERRD